MYATINNILTNYEQYGSDSKPVVLVLHGWKSDSAAWLNAAQSLEKEFRVLLVDIPGFGKSNRPIGTFGTYEYAQFISDFLKYLNIQRCTVVGHSFGGRIALVLAATTEIVEKLILVDAAGIESKPLLYDFLLNILSPLKRLVPQNYLYYLKKQLGSKDYNGAGNLKDIFLKVIKEDLSNLLPKIQISTYIIWGSKDTILDISLAKNFKQLIKSSKIRVIWGAGHHPYLDKPSEFISVLRECLNAE